MREAFGIFFVNVPLLIFSMLIVALGGWLFQGSRGTIRAIGGAFLIAVGGLAFLNAFYFDGFKWINELAGVALVISVGIGLIKNAPGAITTAVGIVVLILGVLSLSQTRPFDNLKIGSGPVAAFDNGFNELKNILGFNEQPRGRHQQDKQKP